MKTAIYPLAALLLASAVVVLYKTSVYNVFRLSSGVFSIL